MRTCGLCGPASAAFTSSMVSGLKSRTNQSLASRMTASRRISKIWRISLALSYGVGIAANSISPRVGAQTRRSARHPRVRNLGRVERKAVVIGIFVVVGPARTVDDQRVGGAEVLKAVPDTAGDDDEGRARIAGVQLDDASE